MKASLLGNRCQCAACGQFFSTTAGFDHHRVGATTNVAPDHGRRCMDASEMEASGLHLDGEVWRFSGYRDWERVRSASA